ncbi:MetQ/NlpA family ABC transporter substrate-binding protein [Clostridium paraputrificum]|uniref:MetQ/NlpA family ABC transporter substrate-binding protein n=1 Tax=Clostridium TaxID=1485 RepID=UPI003D357BD8
MGRKLFIKVITVLCASTLAFGLVSCGKAEEGSNDKKVITIGVSPGPYNDLFDAGVKPILESKGYEVKAVTFSDLLLSEVALTEGQIDFNVAQHTAYANAYNKEKNAELVSIVHIPTVPAGIYSNKYTSIKDIKNGAKVAIPKDPSNAARAYNVLQKAGWIKLKEGIDPMSATLNEIVENPHNLDITLMESLQIPRAMDDIDFAILPGSVVYAAKVDASKSLLSETVIKDLEITAVVDKKNVDTKWAKDIVAAYKSEAFKKYLEENNKDNYWQIPDDLK